jgi:hypothetical protein
MQADNERDFNEFRRRRNARNPQWEERFIRRSRELRPDYSGMTEPEASLTPALTRGRMRATGHLGDAIREASLMGLEVAMAASYEQMYREAHRDTEEPIGRAIHPLHQAVATQKIPDVGLLAAAAHILRTIRTIANPGTDDPEDKEFFAPVLQERLQYFKDLLPDLSGAILHLDNLLRYLQPEVVGFLERQDAHLAQTWSRPKAEQADRIMEREADEPEEEPEDEGEWTAGIAVSTGGHEGMLEQIARQLAAEVERRQATGERTDVISVDIALIPFQGPQEPDSGAQGPQ